jgi:hypothetical protein
MTECAEEHQTQHYRGKWHGFGPVRNSERLLFAVFERTKLAGSRLAADSFSNSNLRQTTQSVARSSYVTRSLFDQRIVQSAGKGVCIGIAIADVNRIRALRADVKLSNRAVKVRSI